MGNTCFDEQFDRVDGGFVQLDGGCDVKFFFAEFPGVDENSRILPPFMFSPDGRNFGSGGKDRLLDFGVFPAQPCEFNQVRDQKVVPLT